jgi:hypothetical protein
VALSWFAARYPAGTMVLVRAVMAVRGVVHGQTASPFGWNGPKPEPNRDDVTSSRL